MSARDTLTPELRAEVLRLEDDLRARVASLPDVQSAWRSEYEAALAAERTASAWESWGDERVTLAAVAWVLTTVFIRFCEDNSLVKPVWISGQRSREAIEAQQQFLRQTARTNADVTDREWLLQAVDHLKSLPATASLVDDTSPMWLVSPSGDAATRLLIFWRERDESGALVRDLTDANLDTRFLGDVYQDISEDAKSRYALLQTPVFVEQFILDRTLEPALNERPLEGFRMIDPACGSGHFLLGGFERLLDRWHMHAPGLDERERVQAALDSVYGVDINPFAVAIARFRLTIAAMRACGISSLEQAPAYDYHTAVGDSLLHGLDQGELDLGAQFSADKVAATFAYETENLEALRSILRNGQYDCVVGNPPYIQPKDRAQNALYRHRYASCSGKYALSVPFMERFFMLAKSGPLAGWTGQITSNSFMKREFGAKLVENFLPTKDLRFVIDSEGAWIPGHNTDGTPTVIIVGRNAKPSSATVRAVLSKTRRETPAQPDGTGPYWKGIVDHLDSAGYESEWLSIVDMDRRRLAAHPWSLSGGGAMELMTTIEGGASGVLGDLVSALGVMGMTNADDAFIAPKSAFERRRVEPQVRRNLVNGDAVRDFRVAPGPEVFFPYRADALIQIDLLPGAYAWLWPARTETWARSTFSKATYRAEGRTWWEWHQISLDRVDGLVIGWSEVATHNHFVLGRGNDLFKQAAPILKLPKVATEADYLALLGVLNSSTVCFWLKQVVQPKGGAADIPWLRTYQHNGLSVRETPLPSVLPLERGSALDKLAVEMSTQCPSGVVARSTPSRKVFDPARMEYDSLRGQMIAQQEELDWEVYRLYGLIDDVSTATPTGAGGRAVEPVAEIPELALGERAFEIVLARMSAAGEAGTAWFERHGSKPITEIPAHWPKVYRETIQARIELIESHPFVGLLETPEHKRRWQSETWETQEERATRHWLLDRLEINSFWYDGQGRPISKSVATLADEVARNDEMTDVLAVWEGRPDIDVATSLARLLAPESVPFLAAYRYKDSGLRKRAAWEHTWELQRREDAGTYNPAPRDRGGDGPPPAPPKYTSADFTRADYWSNRGKLDIPKERFISYPGAGREGDATPVVGWAGWDHAEQALALATLIQSGEQHAWSEDRLIPLVAGLSELLPWVDQWHSEPTALYGGSSPAEFFSGLLDSYMAKLGATRESLAAWRPPAHTRGRKAKS